MSDLKVTFDKLDKVCKQANEEWKKMMEENNTFDTISKTAKDIADMKDREKALEFAKCIGNLFRENGVTAMIEEYRTAGTLKDKNLIEEYYGVSITGLDFAEHDKKFKDEIAQLKHDLEKTYNQLMEVEKESQERIAELKSELEVKDNLLKIKNVLCDNDVELPWEPISVAEMLINAKIEYEQKSLQKALFKTDGKCLADKYSDDDLEQIAEHLLVYCKHNREDEE